MKTENKLLKCRCCKNKINPKVKSCPQCGTTDPVYYWKITRIGGWLTMLNFILSVLLSFSIMGAIGGPIIVLVLGLSICFFLIFKGFGYLIKAFLYNKRGDYFLKMTNIYGNDEDAWDWHRFIDHEIEDLP